LNQGLPDYELYPIVFFSVFNRATKLVKTFELDSCICRLFLLILHCFRLKVPNKFRKVP